MAFDAGMLACVIHEIKSAALGARIEMVSQPAGKGRDRVADAFV